MSSLKLRQLVRLRRFAVVMGCVLFCLPAFAQLNLGRITGAVTDQTGGVIVGAIVTISDVARGINRPLRTDSAGEYNAPSLTPGLYTVRAEAMGFKAVERQNVTVEVGGEIRVDLTLQPGDQTQTVTVTEALPNIDTTNASLGGTLQSQSLAELPINGRDVLKLLNFVPGATTTDGKMFNINGGRTNDQVYIFDGIDELNPYGTGPIVGGTSGFTGATILPLDAIQETNVITSPNAEYGWKFGGTVNLGMKSGTNALHGTAFALGRDNGLDAKNPFLLPNQPKAADSLQQFGGTFGGPIKKDKIFYFVGYEGQRYLVATPAILQSPAALPGAGKSNSIPDAINDILTNSSNTTHIAPSPLSLDLAGCPLVAPFTPCTGGIFFNPTASQNVATAIPNNGGSDNGLAKVDYHLNDKNSLNGEYFIGQGTSNQQSASNSTAEPWWLTLKFTRSQLGRAVWIWTPSSTWLNEMRFGVDREYQTGSPAECSENLGQPNYATAYHFVIQPVPSPLCGFPLTTITGFTPLGTTETSGGPSNVTWTTFAGIDTVSYSRGKHQFKFGFEIHNTVFTGSTKLNFVHGKLTFGSIPAFTGATALEDFLTGQVAQSQILVGNPLIHTNLPRYAGFAQDDWRITKTVTLNLGLRYEIIPPMSGGNNQLGSFSPTQGLTQVGLQINSLYPTYYKAFAPRIGLAWDVTGKGTTVVKAGGTVLYDMNPINSFLSPAQAAAVNIIPTGFKLFAPNGSLLPSPGTLQTANLVGTGNVLVNWQPNAQVFNTNPSNLSCGNGLGMITPGALTNPATNPANAPPCNIQPASPTLTPAYMVTWTIGVQHAITNSASVNVAYVGTRGQNLQQNIDINQPLPGLKNVSTATASLLNEQPRRPFYTAFPYLGQITELTGGAQSTYNALQIQFKEQATRGLTLSASYTYAHTLSNADNTYGSYHEDYTNPNGDFAPAFYDIHNALNLNFTYLLPSFKAPAQLLKGWQINTVLSVLSAQPYPTTDTSTDLSGTGELNDRWSIAGSPSNIKSGVGPIPCFGIAGSTFAGSSNCTTVNTPTTGCTSSTITSATVAGCVQSMPAACVNAAAAERTNINPTSGVTATTVNSTGPWSLASFGCYMMNGTVIVPPAQGTFGNMGRNALRNGLPFREWDFSVAKAFNLTERFKAQFRAEFFNVLNHPIFAVPNSNPATPSTFGATTALNNQSDPILGEGGPRQINLSLKFTF